MQSFSDALRATKKQVKGILFRPKCGLGAYVSPFRQCDGPTVSLSFFVFFCETFIFFSYFLFSPCAFHCVFSPTLFESLVFVFVDCYYNCSGKLVVKKSREASSIFRKSFHLRFRIEKIWKSRAQQTPLDANLSPNKNKKITEIILY